MDTLTQGIPALAIGLLAAQALLLLHAAAHDVAARTIPNASSIAIAAIGLLQRALDHRLLATIAVAGMVFVGASALWRRGWLGGGDVKLVAACSCLVPPLQVPALLAAIMISGGILACLYLVAMRIVARWPGLVRHGGMPPRRLLVRVTRLELWRMRRRAALPYGVAISAGALLHVFGA